MQKINTRKVTYMPTIPIRGDTYQLRSVVVADVTRINETDDIITGCSAIVIPKEGNLFWN